MTILFFGSFQSYSAQVLEILSQHFTVIGVVTTPARPSGRHMKLTPTHVQLWSEKHGVPVYPLENIAHIPEELANQESGPGHTVRPDFLVVAGYGKLIPGVWLTFPRIMAVNMHPSLLPHYRGAMPAEWAILRGETRTGVSLVHMTPQFDTGDILSQEDMAISPSDTRETLYRALYDKGAHLLVRELPRIASGNITPFPQKPGDYVYARRLTKDDGFEPWDTIKKALRDTSQAHRIERKFRALTGWPGLWTKISVDNGKTKKRLKILSCSLVSNYLSLGKVQLEGKKPVTFSQLEHCIY